MIDVLLRQLRQGDSIARRELLAIVAQWTDHPDAALNRLATNSIEAPDLERFVKAIRPTEKERLEREYAT